MSFERCADDPGNVAGEGGTVSMAWESTTLLRVTDEAYVRTDLHTEGREAQKLVECPRCHRVTDWLIVVAAGRVEVDCRCGRRWRLVARLPEVMALAECPPRDPAWTCLEDARAALGFGRHLGRPRRRWHRARRSAERTRRRAPTRRDPSGTAAMNTTGSAIR